VGFVADNFPSDFYVTCATVIPVLFIAFAIEARQLQPPLAAGYRAFRRLVGREGRFRDFVLFAVGLFLPAIIVAFGLAGELGALAALYYGADVRSLRIITFASTAVLLVAVVLGASNSALTAATKAVPPRQEASGEGEAAED
jgi:hypothetical protein